MDTRLIVSICAPQKKNLSKPQRQLLAKLTDRIEQRGLRIQADSADSDNLEDRYRKGRQCHGMIIWGCSQWEARRLNREQEKTVVLTSEFTHIAGVIGVAARRPLLVLREKTVAERGVFRSGYLPHVVKAPGSLKTEWLESSDFDAEFNKWIEEVECFRHVFLGYSSRATKVANIIYKFLSGTMKLRVFDWHDFRLGDSIWDSIERAERLTNCGIFLFMADDEISGRNKREFAPRDNVVYEAGYFAGAKGGKKSLIIREEGAKVPTDLGGILYLELERRNNISSIETSLRTHLERMLSDQD